MNRIRFCLRLKFVFLTAQSSLLRVLISSTKMSKNRLLRTSTKRLEIAALAEKSKKQKGDYREYGKYFKNLHSSVFIKVRKQFNDRVTMSSTNCKSEIRPSVVALQFGDTFCTCSFKAMAKIDVVEKLPTAHMTCKTCDGALKGSETIVDDKASPLVTILGTSLPTANSQQLLALYQPATTSFIPSKKDTSDATMQQTPKQRFRQLESPVRAGSAIFGLPTEL
ncbi:hypothetical protein AB4K20DRAFT_1984045 [Rhizopus microsporus]